MLLCTAYRTKQIEDEMQKLLDTMRDKEEKVLKEKNMLRELVKELSAVVKVHKKRINDLADINKEQEVLLRNQTTVLHSKVSSSSSYSSSYSYNAPPRHRVHFDTSCNLKYCPNK